MNKVFLFATAVVLLSSCTKRYTCKCYIEDAGMREEFLNMTYVDSKSGAQESCNAERKRYQSAVMSGSITCNLEDYKK